MGKIKSNNVRSQQLPDSFVVSQSRGMDSEVLSPLKIHGLIPGRALDVPLSSLSGGSVGDLRAHISPDLPLAIVQNGKQLNDDDSVRDAKLNSRRRLPVFAFVRSGVAGRGEDFSSFCEVKVGDRVLRLLATSRIDVIKEKLFAEGLVSTAPIKQELCLAGRICKDSTLLGDYFLFRKIKGIQQKKRGPPVLMVMVKSGPPAPPATPTVPVVSAAGNLFLQAQRRRAAKRAQQGQHSCTTKFKGLQPLQTTNTVLNTTFLQEVMRLHVVGTADPVRFSPPSTPGKT